MPEIYLKSIQSIFTNKARAMLTFFSIAIGVCAVILTVNIASLGNTALTNEIEGLGMSGLSVSAGNTNAPLTVHELDSTSLSGNGIHISCAHGSDSHSHHHEQQ